MSIDDVKEELADAAATVLEDLTDVAGRLDGTNRSGAIAPDVLVASTGVADRDATGPRERLGAIRSDVTAAHRRLREEPFVARITVRDRESDEVFVLYVCRATPPNFAAKHGKLTSYRSEFGRLAEMPVGGVKDLRLPRGRRTSEVREYEVIDRLQFRPVRTVDAGWDGLEDRFESEHGRFSVDSLRDFVGIGHPTDDEDILARLLRADESAAIREGFRRAVVKGISLRDQPVLDQFQGDVFRLPLDRRIALSGPPGTGKTTTLIQRLALKRDVSSLAEDEQDVPAALHERLFRPDNWVMFTPTELLKLYLKEAFAREQVPAPDQQVRTWAAERQRLGKNVLHVLKSESGGRYILDEDALLLVDTSSPAAVELYEAFEKFFARRLSDRYAEAFAYALANADTTSLRDKIAALRERVGPDPIRFENLFAVVDLQQALGVEGADVRARAERKLNDLGNRILRAHRQLIDEIAQRLTELLPPTDGDDDDDDGDVDAEVSSALTNPVHHAAQCFLRALRSAASAAAAGKAPTRGRYQRLIEFIGERMPSREDLAEAGMLLRLRRFVAFLTEGHRNLISDVPAAFQRFRRASLAEGRLYRVDAKPAIDRSRISGHELDVVLLMMLRNARKLLLRSNRRDLLGETRIAVLEAVKGEFVTQVLVDEATDFSAVQLACMHQLSHPQYSSIFISGDPRQRVTTHGMRSFDELSWVASDFEVRAISVGYRQSRRLTELARRLATISGDAPPVTTTFYDDDAGSVPPVLLENADADALASWLAERIGDIERALTTLPSIAIFVESDDAIAPLLAVLKPLLSERNIQIVGCPEGRVVGASNEVRIFSVEYIKGLEFEAVFFVGVDRLAERAADVFDKMMYVGITRASTYLGLATERKLPGRLEPLRDLLLADGRW